MSAQLDLNVRSILEELRMKLKEIVEKQPQYGEDLFLFPFLKLNKFNVHKAAETIRQSIKWRNEVDLEGILNQDVDEEVNAMIPMYSDNISKNGIPIICIIIGGEVDHRGIISKYGRDRYLQHFYQVIAGFEKAGLEARRKLNEIPNSPENKSGVIVFVDLAKYTFYQARGLAVIQAWIELIKIYKSYAPTCVEALYLLNVNKFFAPIFKIVVPLLEGPCLQIESFNTKSDEWQQQLSQLTDPTQIRQPFGGTKKES